MAASRRKSRARRALERARKTEKILLRARIALEYDGALSAEVLAGNTRILESVLWNIRYRKAKGWSPAVYEMKNGYLHTLERAP